MKKKHLKYAVLCFGLASMLAFAGCGSKTEDNSQAAADNSTTPATEAAAEESAEAAGDRGDHRGSDGGDYGSNH